MPLGNVTCSILVGIIPTLNADSSPRPGWAQGLAQVGPQLRGPGPTWVRAHAGPGGNPKIEIGAGGAPTLKNTSHVRIHAEGAGPHKGPPANTRRGGVPNYMILPNYFYGVCKRGEGEGGSTS